ncbi:dsRNA-binding domain-like protein, partial [Neolentinus lepideus HHB14362 ss-1]
IKRLHQYLLLARRVSQQTGKGKIKRMYALIVVGNGNGMVGYGEGKADELPEAQEQALKEAIRNMDYVERFEKRTIFTEMSSKLGSTQIILRPRPVGFGLACQPQIHQILKAAGIKDCSAKVWGSRNKMNIIKTLFRMLHGGNSPLSMGDGFGGGARRLDKGSGVRPSRDVERERGRKLVDLRTW